MMISRVLTGPLCFLIALASSAQVSIHPGTWITVKEGGSLYIGTDLHIKSGPDSSGYFVDQTIGGDVTITGDIVVERYMTPDEWHNVASPVSNEHSDVFTGTELVFWYNETLIWNDWNFGWVWYDGATGGPLMVFRGYDVYFSNSPVTVNYLAGSSGTLNTGSYTYNVTITDPAPNPIEIPSHMGWNLAGNPYPSPVDWLAATGWDKSDINDAKYIWDGIQDLYTIYLGGSSPVGINGGTRFIPSNQGFWVQAVQTGTIGISNATRLGDISGTPDFYKESEVDYPLVSLMAEGNEKHDEIVIRFIPGTTEAFDRDYDASKLFSFIEEVPQLSILAGKQVMALNTLPEICGDLSVRLGFRCSKAGNYRILLSERTVLEDAVALYLWDAKEQVMTNLRTAGGYEFSYRPDETADRFRLYFNPSQDVLNNITPANYFTVFASGNRISIIKNTEKTIRGKVVVYSMIGQPMVEKWLENQSRTDMNLDVPNGYYIVQIITNQHISNYKVLIIN